MKKNIILILLMIVSLFTITGCGTNKNNNQGNNKKTYKVNGVDIKMDKDDDRDNIKYKTSSSFTSKYTTTGTSYTLYKDENKDKYDLTNIVLRVDVNVDIMNMESTIERTKELIKRNDSFKNVEQDQKIIKNTTWDYFIFDNAKDETNTFKEHVFITEKQVNNYYYLYKISFAFADDIEEFEKDFMNSILFE